MNCACTICAKNYLGIAQVLRDSFLQHNPDADFHIFIADEPEADLDLDANTHVARNVLDIPGDIWVNMSFKYDLTEFCTSIKPFCFEMLLANYEKVAYLDPDIFVFSSMDYVYSRLDTYLFVTTPHIISPEEHCTGDIPDVSFLRVGVNNCGFIAARKSPKTEKIVKWWEERLIHQCFNEQLASVFDDQKWTIFLPAFLDEGEYLCSRHMGINLAPWNYYERKIVREDGNFYVRHRFDETIRPGRDRLIFAHFAGYNYKVLAQGKVERVRIADLRKFEDVEMIFRVYADVLQSNRDRMLLYFNLPYSYACFDNGTPIDLPHRRFYNGLYNSYGFRENPFRSASTESFYFLLKKARLLDLSSGKGMSVDKVKPDNLGHFGTKLIWLHRALKFLLSLVGYRHYILFFKLMRYFCRYENQTFLMGKKYADYNLKHLKS